LLICELNMNWKRI